MEKSSIKEKQCEKCGSDISNNKVRLISVGEDYCLKCYLARLNSEDIENEND